jgi:cytochrome c oxidase subunit 2
MLLTLSYASPSTWWLPPDYARHGRSIDLLLMAFLAVVAVVFLLTQGLLLWALVRYRRRPPAAPGSASTGFTHGNARLEIAWTAIPLALLLGMAAASTHVWNQFRNSAEARDPARSRILIIGQQFKWNIIYPGPDGIFGRYLRYPRPTDLAWPVGPQGRPTRFAGVPGPAALPPAQAAAAVQRYIDLINPLGKDFTDPAGRDDDYQAAATRPLYLPVNRPVEIDLMSKDVIHDLYLPNFRAQLYAVPGMVGKLVFTPTVTSAQLRAAGQPDPQFACAQLCGLGHSVMGGTVVVLSQAEYDSRFAGNSNEEIRMTNQYPMNTKP